MSSKKNNSRKKCKSRATERSSKTSKASMNDEKHEVGSIDSSKIAKFIKRTLEKGPNGLRAEFQAMKRTNNWELMKAFKAANELNRNRYKDVGCLDASRVKLNSPPWEHEYIHGNYVTTPTSPKRFICTQAPLEKTCADFWYMCLQDRVEVIFMLCNFTEKGAKKCFEYYPTKSGDLTFEEGSNKVTVKFSSSKIFKFKGDDIKAKVRETVLTVEGLNEKPLRTRHYHWIDWPDRGVPPADDAIIQLLDRTRGTKNPIAVHCSAGIGRTGCVVMLEYMLEQLSQGQELDDTDKILVKIREQRNNSIQTDHQYLFVHQVMLNFFRTRGLFTGDIESCHNVFTKDYSRLVV